MSKLRNNKLIKSFIYFICLFLIVSVLLFLINKYKLYNLDGANNTKLGIENFYTLFTPFKSKSDLITKYVNLTNSTDYSYDTVMFGITYRNDYIELYEFMSKVLKTIIAESPILKFDLMKYNHSRNVCIDVMKNNLNFGIIPNPILLDALTGFNTVFDKSLNFNNLRFIANVGDQYVYLIIRKDSGIKNVADLRGKRIGMGMEKGITWKVARDFMDFMKMKDGTEADEFMLTDKESLLALKNNQLDAMFFTDYYPSNFINDIFIKHNPHGLLTLLPITGFDTEAFKLSYYYYEQTTMDLNKMPITFLPIKTGNVYYTRFNPDFPTFSFKQVIISNQETPTKTVYEFTKQYFSNIYKFKDNPVLNKDKNNLFQLSVDRSMLFIHEGAYKYYQNMGYLTKGESDKNCVYLVGKTVCNKRNLDIVKHSMIE